MSYAGHKVKLKRVRQMRVSSVRPLLFTNLHAYVCTMASYKLSFAEKSISPTIAIVCH